MGAGKNSKADENWSETQMQGEQGKGDERQKRAGKGKKEKEEKRKRVTDLGNLNLVPTLAFSFHRITTLYPSNAEFINPNAYSFHPSRELFTKSTNSLDDVGATTLVLLPVGNRSWYRCTSGLRIACSRL